MRLIRGAIGEGTEDWQREGWAAGSHNWPHSLTESLSKDGLLRASQFGSLDAGCHLPWEGTIQRADS